MKQEKRQPVFESPINILERVRLKLEKTRVQWETHGRPELPFGIPILDKMTLGIDDLLTIIGSRTSEGKTALALQIANGLADMGKTVLYMTIEDTVDHIMERMISQLLQLDNQLVRMGKVQEEHYATMRTLLKDLKLMPIGGYGFNWGEVETVLDELKQSEQLKPDVVIFDYLQNIETAGYPSRYEAIKAFANKAVIWNARNKIPLIVLSQINREAGEHEIPNLRHFEQGGSIEQSGYKVLILHQPHRHGMASFDYNKKLSTGMEHCPDDYAECRIAKNKTGPVGIIPLRFTGRFYRFTEWPQPEIPNGFNRRKDLL